MSVDHIVKHLLENHCKTLKSLEMAGKSNSASHFQPHILGLQLLKKIFAKNDWPAYHCVGQPPILGKVIRSSRKFLLKLIDQQPIMLSSLPFSYFTLILKLGSPLASHFRCWKQNWNSASLQPPIFRIYKKSNFLLTGLTFSYFMSIPKLSSLQPLILGVESKTETRPPISLPFSEFTHSHISLQFPNWAVSSLTF